MPSSTAVDAIYLDTSALMKRYFREEGSAQLQKLLSGQPIVVTAALTYAETYATVYRLARDGIVKQSDVKPIVAAFEQDWRAFAILTYDLPVREQSAQLAATYPVRGTDLVHLSSACVAREQGLDLNFVASDLRLLNAAEGCGFAVINPAES